ncbi:unnamed protein product, partial [Allacma fusca]
MFLLVQWVNDRPKTWSVVSVDLLSDGRLRKGKNLVGMVVGINWKRHIHQAIVIESGLDETALECNADALAERELQKSNTSATTSSRKIGNSRKRGASTSNAVSSDTIPGT